MHDVNHSPTAAQLLAVAQKADAQTRQLLRLLGDWTRLHPTTDYPDQPTAARLNQALHQLYKTTHTIAECVDTLEERTYALRLFTGPDGDSDGGYLSGHDFGAELFDGGTERYTDDDLPVSFDADDRTWRRVAGTNTYAPVDGHGDDVVELEVLR